MNWVFDAYSNVYQAAMLQPHDTKRDAAFAKERANVKRSGIFGLFGRR